MVGGAVGASAPRRRTWVGGRDMGHYRNCGPQDLGDFRAREGLSPGVAWLGIAGLAIRNGGAGDGRSYYPPSSPLVGARPRIYRTTVVPVKVKSISGSSSLRGSLIACATA